MLTVDLAQLWRDGSVAVEASVPADAALWEESGFRWAEPVEIRLTASNAGTGEIVVRGTVSGALAHECRRCLKPVEKMFRLDATIVFVEEGAEQPEEGSSEYAFDPNADLDVSQAVREEVILAVNPYVVCDAECRGMCSGCGVDLNVGECTCEGTEMDPRWEALRALTKE